MRDAKTLHAEIEESICVAEETIAQLSRVEGEQSACEARWLEKMTQALRLALVAGVDAALLTRLHLRLETSQRRASMLLAQAEQVPPSQRPTYRPPPGEQSVDLDSLIQATRRETESGLPSQHPTYRPPPRESSTTLKRVEPKVKRRSA